MGRFRLPNPGLSRSTLIVRSFGYALAALSMVFAIRYVGLHGESFGSALTAIAGSKLLVALGLFALHVAVSAMAFERLNRALGVVLPAAELRFIWMSTVLAKYVPGGLGHVLGRGLLLARRGVSTSVALKGALWQQGMTVGYCTLAAALLLGATSAVATWLWVLAAVAASSLLLLPAVGTRIAYLRPFSAGMMFKASACYGLSLIPYAAGYLVLANTPEWLRFLASLFAGTVVGVLAFVVPGGLGVRESAALMMSPPGVAETILAAMVAARVLIFFCEVAVSVIGMRGIRANRRGP